MKTIKSKDNTIIAYEVMGNGPAIILVAAAAASHEDAAGLAAHLAEHFTVYNYDRRGRGQSSDTLPYTVDREIEDIEALIDIAGGSAALFGSSSGSVLALEAASKLNHKVSQLYMFEPPFIVSDMRPAVPQEYVKHLNELTDAGKRGEAVEYFMTAAVGVPSEFLEFMKADPSWTKMEQMAHTLAYDGEIMGSTQSGKPLPVNRWHISVPTLVLAGENSEPFLHEAAKALTNLLKNSEYRALAGLDHGAVFTSPKELAQSITEFAQLVQ